MKMVIEDAPTLKSAIDSIVSLVEEGVFEIRKEGLHLKAMDPSQISMVSFLMPKTAFSEYEVSEETKIGLDIANFSNILSRGKKGENVEISLDDGRLSVKFFTGKHRRTFKVPLLNIGEGLQKEPKIEYANHVKIRAEALKDVLRDAKLISSHVRLLMGDSHFIVEVKGDNGDLKAEFEKGGEEMPEFSVSKGAKATFPLQYLEDIIKASSSASPVSLYLETDRPMKVEYEIEGAKVVYFLAPRIESE